MSTESGPIGIRLLSMPLNEAAHSLRLSLIEAGSISRNALRGHTGHGFIQSLHNRTGINQAEANRVPRP